jgi:hypothetical protein
MYPFLKLAFAKRFPSPGKLYLDSACAALRSVVSGSHVNATIDASKTGAPITKNIYGQFLEHGGDIVNTGIWSEMLVGRKFVYPVAATRAHAISRDVQRGGEPALPPHAHAGGRLSGTMMSSLWIPSRPTQTIDRRSSNSTRNRTASARRELTFAKARSTPDALCWPALPAR